MSMKRALTAGLFAGMLWAVPAGAQLSPQATVESFKVAPGLEASPWASEPEMVNPTNMDIDERGRIWVTEAANYRGSVTRDEGDRIMILEDAHHTGRCDSYKVFVQDKKLFAPLGICKLGNKLIVAQSPNILVYTIDSSGDHPTGEPEVLFTGFEGVNHDHGVHAGVFGPDARFYFNCGNEGGRGVVKHADGQPVIDITGSEVGSAAKIWRGKPKPHGFVGPRDGFAFSCNLDGSSFETLAYNFRNNYELCVDSFGTVWQSDNDDDGNQGCRINYVMEGGNFGFTGPNGSSWGRDQAQFPGQTRQQAHWHQLWPGVVPNVLHTGGGAPCGICVYEGNLLPEQYSGALIHADAGPNVVRAYITQPSEHVAVGIMSNDGDPALDKIGAGYTAESVDLIKAKDSWFRPCDVCVAPDGAVYVADWYDPGVGGHATGDTGAHEHDWHKLHGRIYRLAPVGYRPGEVKLDLDSVPGQIAALESPNLSTRYLGYTRLMAGGAEARNALKGVYDRSDNPRFRARALWLLARGDGGQQAVEQALKDKDSDIRVTAIRAARLIKMDMIKLADELIGDPSPAVRRELCLALNYQPDDRAIPALVKLADKYDGTDRWYLEAFGIGSTGREKQVLEAWKKGHQNQDPKVARGIEWRLNLEPTSLGAVAGTALNAKPQLVTAWWALGPFPAENDPLEHDYGPEKSPNKVDLKAAFRGVDNKPIQWEQIKTTDGGADAAQEVDFVQFCKERHFRTDSVVGYFATIAVADEDGIARLIVGSDDGIKVWLNGKVVHANDAQRALHLGDDEVTIHLKKGRNLLLCKLRQGGGPSGIAVAVAAAKPVTFSLDLDPAAAISTPSPANSKDQITKDGQKLEPIAQLAALSGNAAAGEKVFRNAAAANCIRCHQLRNEGGIVGPPLTTIGQKLNKAQLYESILYPSAAIEMGYETWVVKTRSGDVLSGRKVEDTDDHVTLLDVDGKYHDIPADQVARKVKQNISLMPEGVVQAMTRQELVDLVEFLSKLK